MSALPMLPRQLENLAAALAAVLPQWARRDDSRPQPEVRLAGQAALDAIDAAVFVLQQARQQLVTELRASDRAAVARADALLVVGNVKADISDHRDGQR